MKVHSPFIVAAGTAILAFVLGSVVAVLAVSLGVREAGIVMVVALVTASVILSGIFLIVKGVMG